MLSDWSPLLANEILHCYGVSMSHVCLVAYLCYVILPITIIVEYLIISGGRNKDVGLIFI